MTAEQRLGPVDARQVTAFSDVESEPRRRGWLIRRMLLLADVVGLMAAFLAAELVFRGGGGSLAEGYEYLVFLATIPGWIFMAKVYRLYDHDEERADHSTADEVWSLFHFVSIGAWIFFAGAWVTGLAAPNFKKTALFWLLTILLVAIGRSIARAFCRRRSLYTQNCVIVGAGGVAQQVAEKLQRHPEYGLNLLGFVDLDHSDDDEQARDLAGLPVMPASALRVLIHQLRVERVVIAEPDGASSTQVDFVRSLQESSVQVDVVPKLHELIGPGVVIHTVEGLPLVSLPAASLTRSSRFVKRMLDVAAASVALVFLAPLFVLIAILIKLDTPGRVFFRQVRRGALETTFRIFKFRTMVADADARKGDFAHLNKHLAEDPRMFKIPNDPRMTRVGRVLRRYRLDELPQLVNVIRGEMSLVGPRPLILDEDREVRDWARRRLDLKPGMTGLWQVLGSSQISFEEMVRLDYLYVTTWSLGNDIQLLLRTIPFVIRGGGDGLVE